MISLLLSAAALTSEGRLEYTYSMIPGGISSYADFEPKRELLKEHYAGIGFLRPTVISVDTTMWALYRKDSAILMVPGDLKHGEIVFSDRNGNLIRGRCGNRLARELPPAARTFVPPEKAESVVPWVQPEEISTELKPLAFEVNWPKTGMVDVPVDQPLIPPSVSAPTLQGPSAPATV